MIAFFVVFAGIAAVLLQQNGQPQVQAQVIDFDYPQPNAQFERITAPRALVFPLDHGPHPDFLTEWWYYTGNLMSTDGHRFGYQLTFFRRALQPAELRVPRQSNLAAEQIFMAHLAISDASTNRFFAYERFERGAGGLAGASGEPIFQVWLRDWSVAQTDEDEYHLYAKEGSVTLDLRMVDTKGIILQGDQAYSRKGPEEGNASLYYSQPRLESHGTLTIDESAYSVIGLSWLDREISTSALSDGQVGWDWFALQLDDGSELMVYLLRRDDGSVDRFSSGTFIGSDGITVPLGRDDFQVLSTGKWRSPYSGVDYPSGWEVRVPSQDLSLQVEPLLADQELNLSFTYWEGAVVIGGTRAGKALAGTGYVELTGYARSLEGGL